MKSFDIRCSPIRPCGRFRTVVLLDGPQVPRLSLGCLGLQRVKPEAIVTLFMRFLQRRLGLLFYTQAFIASVVQLVGHHIHSMLRHMRKVKE